jgi:hypothetical protein
MNLIFQPHKALTVLFAAFILALYRLRGSVTEKSKI